MNLNNIIFLDIETVPLTESQNELPPALAELWADKCDQLRKRSPERYGTDDNADEMFHEAGIFAEFGKIVCISVGFIHQKAGKNCFRVKSFYGNDEHKLLTEFADLLNNFCMKNPLCNLCGHNSKEFDIPYIARRMLINGISLPDILNVAGKKPWECKFIDTMDLWKFGDYKHYTSLKLLCAVFNIKTPKDDIDGSQVANVFYKEKDVERIAKYCEKDVVATAQVFLRLSGKDIIDEENIEHV